jgi:hypothetical protein
MYILNIMKNYLFLFLLFPIFSKAQVLRGQSEVSVSSGLMSFSEAFPDGPSLSFDEERGPYWTSGGTGIPSLTYRYYLGGRFALGVTIGQQTVWGTTVGENEGPSGNYTFDYKTIAVDFLFNYVNKEWFRLYSYLEPGQSFKKETFVTAPVQYLSYTSPGYTATDNVTVFNLQYVPIGVSIGKKLSGFFEVGFGFKGFLNSGVSYRFPAKRKSLK